MSKKYDLVSEERIQRGKYDYIIKVLKVTKSGRTIDIKYACEVTKNGKRIDENKKYKWMEQAAASARTYRGRIKAGRYDGD